MSLSVDYPGSDVAKTIDTIGGNAPLRNCRSLATNPAFAVDNEYCRSITRWAATGNLANISVGPRGYVAFEIGF
jgi:hypothetical protein